MNIHEIKKRMIESKKVIKYEIAVKDNEFYEVQEFLLENDFKWQSSGAREIKKPNSVHSIIFYYKHRSSEFSMLYTYVNRYKEREENVLIKWNRKELSLFDNINFVSDLFEDII